MTQTGNEYAQALFALACEKDLRAEYAHGMALADGILSGEDEYLAFLACPGIQKSERTAALTEAFGGALPEDVLSLLCLLCEHGKIRTFHECAEEYERLYRESERTCVAQVVSAFPLSEQQQELLRRKLSALSCKTVTLSCTVDTALIGGLTVTLDGRIMDGSLRSRLQDMKDVIHR